MEETRGEEKKMKISFKKVMCIMLVSVMIFSCATSVYAARAKKYVSDLKISYDHEGPNAKQALIDQGYIVVEQDLNEDADDILSKSRVVYMGYKITQKPEEAITDVAMMSEENGYSFSDYQDFLREKLSAFDDLAVKEMNMLKDFRVSYKAGNPLAVIAYNSLNNFMEDDSGKLVGDFLLDEGLKHEDLFKFITQTSQMMQNSFNILIAAAITETTDNNFMTRLSVMSAEQIAQTKKNTTYHEDAKLLLEQAKALHEELAYAKTFVDTVSVMTDEEKKAKEEDAEWQLDLVKQTKTMDVGETLKTVMVGEKSLYDVMADIITKDDVAVTELYPLVSVLTKGQVAAIAFVGYTNFIGSMAKIGKEDGEKLIETTEKKSEVISAYFGVDRIMFTDDVAITSSALREINATADKSAIYGRSSDSLAIGLAIGTGLGIGIASITVTYLAKLGSYVSTYLDTLRPLNFITGGIDDFTLAITRLLGKSTTPGLSTGENALLIKATKVAQMGTWLLAISVVTAIACTGLLVKELFDIYNPEYAKVPKIMLDKIDPKDGKGEATYVRYNVVNGQDDKPGDVNGFAGKRWNALYFTKEQSAGKPLEANIQIANNNTTLIGKNYLGVHEFGAPTAVNLNNFTFSSSAKKTYLYFTKDLNYVPPSDRTGSVFTDMMTPIVAGLTGILIGVAGSVIVIRVRKVKKPTTSQNPIG